MCLYLECCGLIFPWVNLLWTLYASISDGRWQMRRLHIMLAYELERYLWVRLISEPDNAVVLGECDEVDDANIGQVAHHIYYRIVVV